MACRGCKPFWLKEQIIGQFNTDDEEEVPEEDAPQPEPEEEE